MGCLLYTRFPTVMERIQAIKASLGEIKPDLILEKVNLVNVYTCEVERGVDIAIKGRLIVRVGDCSDLKSRFSSVETINCEGLYVIPGLVDAHVHIESSMLVPRKFARLALLHGTTAIFYDCHEVGNVLGIDGIREFALECSKLPLYAFLTVPSCIPACRLGLETAPNVLSHVDIEYLKKCCPDVAALGEVMDCLSILNCDVELLKSITDYYSYRLRVNAHAAGLRGTQLQAYISAGPDSDHEVTDPDEAIEKLRRGLYVMIRLGTYARDLYRVLPKILREANSLDRVMIVSDDINVLDLVSHGYLDRALREAVRLGADPIIAVKLCTLNPATYYGLDWLIGGISPGRIANMVLVDSLEKFNVKIVICDGYIVTREGKLLIELPEHRYPSKFYHTVHVPVKSPEDFSISIPVERGEAIVNIIMFERGSVLTRLVKDTLPVRQGRLVLPEDYLYISVIERHGKSGTYSTAICGGIPLSKGAIALSICHDSHNVVVIGKSEIDMYTCVKKLEEIRGGLCLSCDGKIRALVELPVAGLMSEEEPEILADKLRLFLDEWGKLGGSGELQDLAPLMLTSLVVIPEVRLTDRGLVNVREGKFIPLIEEYRER